MIFTIGLLAEILNNTPEEVEDRLRLEDSGIEAALQASGQFRQLVDNETIPAR